MTRPRADHSPGVRTATSVVPTLRLDTAAVLEELMSAMDVPIDPPPAAAPPAATATSTARAVPYPSWVALAG